MDRRQDYIIIDDKPIKAIVAITEAEQAKGLMYQKWPPPVMCFPYKDAGIRTFWMKNTESPLDIIFCYNNKVIDIKAGNPYDYTLIHSSGACDLVIEMPRGEASENNIKIGSTVYSRFSLKTLNKFTC